MSWQRHIFTIYKDYPTTALPLLRVLGLAYKRDELIRPLRRVWSENLYKHLKVIAWIRMSLGFREAVTILALLSITVIVANLVKWVGYLWVLLVCF